MKKIYIHFSIFVLIIAIILVVSGCGRKSERVAEKPATEKSSEAGEAKTATSSSEIAETATSTGETATSTEDVDTSDWKVYKNEEYGFELRYPEDELYIKKEDNDTEIHFYGKENCSDIASPMSPPGPKCMNININVKKLSKNIVSLNDLISKENLDLAPKNERIEIDGREVIVSEFFLDNGDPYVISAVILGNNYYYEIDMGGQYFFVTEEFKNKFYKFLDNFKIL